MTRSAGNDSMIKVVPATAECWPDVEALFGQNGANAGCWCMFWRLDRKDFKQMKGEGTRAVLRSMIENNEVPGVLAYQNGQAIGWCALGPREDFAALENSRILKRLDTQPVWSIVCFFIAKPYRQQGMTQLLLKGAVDYAISKGAKIIEGYPIDLHTPQLQGQKLNSYSGYMGIASVFQALGFREVARASQTQLIMRFYTP